MVVQVPPRTRPETAPCPTAPSRQRRRRFRIRRWPARGGGRRRLERRPGRPRHPRRRRYSTRLQPPAGDHAADRVDAGPPTTRTDDHRRRRHHRRRRPAPTRTSTATLAGTVVHLNPEAAQLHDRRRRQPDRDPLRTGRRTSARRSRSRRGCSPTAPTSRPATAPSTAAAARPSFDGTVSFRDPVTGVYTVSAPGVSLLVRGGAPAHSAGARRAGRGRGRGSPTTPSRCPVSPRRRAGLRRAAGAAEAAEDRRSSRSACRSPRASRRPRRTSRAIVEGVCRDTRKLIVCADDLRESGRDIELPVTDGVRARQSSTPATSLRADDRDPRRRHRSQLEHALAGDDERRQGRRRPDLVQTADSSARVELPVERRVAAPARSRSRAGRRAGCARRRGGRRGPRRSSRSRAGTTRCRG